MIMTIKVGDIMILNNVTKFDKVVIKITAWTSSKMVNFHEQRPITLEGMVQLWNIIELEEDIMVLNKVTKFHKFVSQITGLIDRTPVNFH